MEALAASPVGIPWAMQMKAVSAVEPWGLVRTLAGAIRGCGGWVLSRRTSEMGTIKLLFEFERRACMDIYCALMASGVELSPLAHRRLTELCQCTRSRRQRCEEEIASVELEIQTFPAELAAFAELQ